MRTVTASTDMSSSCLSRPDAGRVCWMDSCLPRGAAVARFGRGSGAAATALQPNHSQSLYLWWRDHACLARHGSAVALLAHRLIIATQPNESRRRRFEPRLCTSSQPQATACQTLPSPPNRRLRRAQTLCALSRPREATARQTLPSLRTLSRPRTGIAHPTLFWIHQAPSHFLLKKRFRSSQLLLQTSLLFSGACRGPIVRQQEYG